jgi:hypothetical protein
MEHKLKIDSSFDDRFEIAGPSGALAQNMLVTSPDVVSALPTVQRNFSCTLKKIFQWMVPKLELASHSASADT